MWVCNWAAHNWLWHMCCEMKWHLTILTRSGAKWGVFVLILECIFVFCPGGIPKLPSGYFAEEHIFFISQKGAISISKRGYITGEFLKHPKVAALNWLLKFMKVATLMKVEMYTFILFFIYFDSIQNKSKYIFEHFHAFILIFPKFVASILWLKVYLDISSHMRLDLHLKTKPNRSVLI